MLTAQRARLAGIRRFDQLIAYLREEMDWPIASDDFEELTFDFTPEELGIEARSAARIQEIKRLRPLSAKQPWGIYFVKFEPGRLPVVALRRILGQVTLKKRASANSADRAAWGADDLLFISNYGEGEERQISFAHFASAPDGRDLPTLKVLGWNDLDTELRLDAVARELTEHLRWPDDEDDTDAWRTRWRSAFSQRHGEVIKTSKQLAVRLAELARVIRDRMKTTLAIESESGPLSQLMTAFRETLVHDLDADGFADMYAQTIAYGLLSARIADPTSKPADDFAAHMRTNPFLRELMQTFLHVGGRRGTAGGPGIDFDELGVSDVVELLDDANMEAVVRDFGDRNPLEDPVIHFYELFLKEYDARKRMQRGVFYTPRPVVSYIVRSVDELLRTEFGLEDGLADTTTWGEMAERRKDLSIPAAVAPDQDFVQILDPATGTGTFLVEAIDVIHKTLVANWKGQGHSDQQIAGLWNRYVPKHLLTRLHAYELQMAPYAIAHLKVGLKLYATGYRFDSEERARIYLTNALEPDTDIQPTLELLPALAREAQAVSLVKRDARFTVVIGNPPYSNFGKANDNPWIRDLLKDFRGSLTGESKINLYDDYIKFIRLAFHAQEQSGAAVIGLITNRSFLEGATQREMRAYILRAIDGGRILDLYRGIYDAEANDQNVFAITQGVAVTTWWSGTQRQGGLLFRRLVGTYDDKARLLSNGPPGQLFTTRIAPAQPDFLLVPTSPMYPEYAAGVEVPSLFVEGTTGVQTNRDALVIDTNRDTLLSRIVLVARSETDALSVTHQIGVPATGHWKPSVASAALRQRGVTDVRIVPYLYRPFDSRFVYYDRAVVHNPRELVGRTLASRPLSLLVSRGVDDPLKGVAFVARGAADKRSINSAKGEAKWFPVATVAGSRTTTNMFGGGSLDNVKPPDGWPDRSASGGRVVSAAYAVLSAPSYRQRYSEELRRDYPRIPVPASVSLLLDLERLGDRLIRVHLLESLIAVHQRPRYDGPRSPWVGRVSWSDDVVSLQGTRGSSASSGARFEDVPRDVWDLHIGGYQVCAKWLGDRKGTSLSPHETGRYADVVGALRETIRLTGEIEAAIERHGGWPVAFGALMVQPRALVAAERRADYGADS